MFRLVVITAFIAYSLNSFGDELTGERMSKDKEIEKHYNYAIKVVEFFKNENGLNVSQQSIDLIAALEVVLDQSYKKKNLGALKQIVKDFEEMTSGLNDTKKKALEEALQSNE